MKLFKKERRKRNQTGPESDVPFEFNLMLSGRRELPGTLVDVSLGGAAISFPQDRCPIFEKDERVRLSLRKKQSEESIMLDSLVRDGKTDQGTRLYQFQFIDTSILLRDLDPTLMSYFNRREAFRVRPDPLDPIDVTIVSDEITVNGLIMDISITGIALAMDRSSARKLEYKEEITLTFMLPDHEGGMLTIIGKPAHFVPLENDVRYGISFLWKETGETGQKERLISRYVMQRQMALSKSRTRGPIG